jgi:NAD(P)-dependent dehydrogenase (short-subunit alcohol dehydrogenase family)
MSEPERRVVMVSGANRGIGGAVARRLGDAGYRLSLDVRRESEIARIRGDYDTDRTLLCSYEAADRKSPTAWVEATIDRFGRLDAIVNAAGILRRFGVLDDDEDVFDELIEVNVKGPMRLIRAAYPHLRDSGAGRIVNLASLSGLRVKGGSAGYAMSKFALVALTHSARQLGWADGVRATAICPGWVDTDMVAGVDAVPQAEMIRPADVATLVQTAIEMPNTASLAYIPVNCVDEPYF